MSLDRDLDGFEVYAWIGEDEWGSGEIGLKQAFTAAGLISLVAVDRSHMDRHEFILLLQQQYREFGKPMRLVRLTYAETLKRVGT